VGTSRPESIRTRAPRRREAGASLRSALRTSIKSQFVTILSTFGEKVWVPVVLNRFGNELRIEERQEPHGGLQTFHQKSTWLTQLTLGPNLVTLPPGNVPVVLDRFGDEPRVEERQERAPDLRVQLVVAHLEMCSSQFNNYYFT